MATDYHTHETFYAHNIFIDHNQSDNKREDGNSGWEEQTDLSPPTNHLCYISGEPFLFMSAKKPTLDFFLRPLNLKKKKNSKK